MMETNKQLKILCLLAAIAAFWSTSCCCQAFTTAPTTRAFNRAARVSTSLNAGGLFGENSPLANIFGNKEQGPKTILEIPAKDVKIGALRFLLNIYLVGEQNKPEKESWFTRQGDDGDLQVYYKDGTGMISFELQEYSVRAIRHGEKPSLQYQLQESVLLHGVLDELYNTAFEVDDSIEEEKRLLVLNDESAIEKAREKLPARQD